MQKRPILSDHKINRLFFLLFGRTIAQDCPTDLKYACVNYFNFIRSFCKSKDHSHGRGPDRSWNIYDRALTGSTISRLIDQFTRTASLSLGQIHEWLHFVSSTPRVTPRRNIDFKQSVWRFVPDRKLVLRAQNDHHARNPYGMQLDENPTTCACMYVYMQDDHVFLRDSFSSETMQQSLFKNFFKIFLSILNYLYC